MLKMIIYATGLAQFILCQPTIPGMPYFGSGYPIQRPAIEHRPFDLVRYSNLINPTIKCRQSNTIDWSINVRSAIAS